MTGRGRSCGQGERRWGVVGDSRTGVSNYRNHYRSSPSSHPLTSNSHPNGTCPQGPEGRGRGQAVERGGRQGPLEPEACEPRRLKQLWSLYAGKPRATSSSPHSGRPSHLPVVTTTPSPCPSALIKTSESFAGVLSHRSGRPSHQAVLCQLPRESKCRAFPAKTYLRHAVANAHTFAVKRAGARCPIPG